MKRICNLTLTATLVLSLCACAKASTWQEQYDLGIRYLSEGNYEEAIIAFTAAIEIDPKQAPAYVGRSDAYVGKAETLTPQSEEYTKAEADYLTAIEIDTSAIKVYQKLADLYLAVGDIEKAIAALDQGYAATGDETLHSRRQELGVSGSDEVLWTDPVFEKLIREKIGIPTGPVYVQDLDHVTVLSIYGDTDVFINDDEDIYSGSRIVGPGGRLVGYYGKYPFVTIRGQITNVDTLRYFRNLSYIHIIANHITDVSVLREMKNLEGADFWANDISDLSPIYELQWRDEWRNEWIDAMNAEQFLEIGDIIITVN
jgi:tetratricopeptide (TPR) repeat protein